MTNEIIDAISIQLNSLFPEWHIYEEDTKQNIQTPCFIIKLVGAPQRELLGPRVRITEMYSVALICPGDIRLLHSALELAAVSLRFIDMADGQPLFALNREGVMVDDSTANITFSISRTVWFKHSDPKQEILDYTIRSKE